MKRNSKKIMTWEDKFGRNYYCQKAKRFIKHQKKENSKKFRRILKKELTKEIENDIIDI